MKNDNHNETAKHIDEDLNKNSDSFSSVSLSSISFTEGSDNVFTLNVTLEQYSNTYFSDYLGGKRVKKFLV